jgi:hypothetical protein
VPIAQPNNIKLARETSAKTGIAIELSTIVQLKQISNGRGYFIQDRRVRKLGKKMLNITIETQSLRSQI